MVPNGAIGLSTVQKRNAELAKILIAKGKLRFASQEEVNVWLVKYDRHTANIVRHLNYAVANNRWSVVEGLANTLQYRTGNHHPINGAKFFQVVK